MNVVHCPGCAQSLHLPESASSDTTLQCPHCGAVHQVEQFLPASPEAELDAAEPEVIFNEHAQDEFSQGEILADASDSETEADDQGLELLSFDEDREELPMLDLETDDESEELPMMELDAGDESEELPSLESEPIAFDEEPADTDSPLPDASAAALPMMDLGDEDEYEELPNFESDPIAEDASDDDSMQPAGDADVVAPGLSGIDSETDNDEDDSLPMMELEPEESAEASMDSEPVAFAAEAELDAEAANLVDNISDEDGIELPSMEFESIDGDDESDAASNDDDAFAAAALIGSVDSEEIESSDSEEPLAAEEETIGMPLGFTEFDRESAVDDVDDSAMEDELELDVATKSVPAAPKRSRVASLVTQVVCPECNDPVRMPESAAGTDAVVRCPWCGQTNALSVFANQLAPALEVVSPGSGPAHAAVAAIDASAATSGWGGGTATEVESTESAEYESNPYPGFDDAPVMEPAGFDMSAHGLQPRARRRQKPSIIKMLIQWFGGGVLGIGGALAILYFGFPEKFPKFLPFQPPSNRSSSVVGGSGEFVPMNVDRNNDFGGSDFVVNNENSELLESIDLPNVDDSESVAADDAQMPAVAADEPTAIDPEPAPSVVEQRLQTAREALALAIETEKGSSDFNVNRNSLYRGLADLAVSVSDNPFSKHPKKEAARLLASLGEDRQLMTSLAGLAPQWLSSSRRGSDGIFLVAKLGSKTKAQSRPGYHSIQLARYIGESSPAEPITLFGLLDDLMPYQDQNVMILAVIENDAVDITGDGSLLKLSAIQPL
ncbi:hypothetical protein [Rosistilla carotiformis]|nr:hypothetical protein [Rosistilla carotiformis]